MCTFILIFLPVFPLSSSLSLGRKAPYLRGRIFKEKKDSLCIILGKGICRVYWTEAIERTLLTYKITLIKNKNPDNDWKRVRAKGVGTEPSLKRND